MLRKSICSMVLIWFGILIMAARPAYPADTPTPIPLPVLYHNVNQAPVCYGLNIEGELSDTSGLEYIGELGYTHASLDVHARMLNTSLDKPPSLSGITSIVEYWIPLVTGTPTPVKNNTVALQAFSRPYMVLATTPTPISYVGKIAQYAGVEGLAHLTMSDAKIAGAGLVVGANLRTYPSTVDGNRAKSHIDGASGLESNLGVHANAVWAWGLKADLLFAGRYAARLYAPGQSPEGVTVTNVYGTHEIVNLANPMATIKNVYGSLDEIHHGNPGDQGDTPRPTPTGTPTLFVGNAYAVYADLDIDPEWVDEQRLSIRGIGGRALIGPAPTPNSADYLEIYQPVADANISTNPHVTRDLAGDWVCLNPTATPNTEYTVASFHCPLPHSGTAGSCTRIVGVKAIFSYDPVYSDFQSAKPILRKENPGEVPTSYNGDWTTALEMTPIPTTTPSGQANCVMRFATGWDVITDTNGPESVWLTIKLKYDNADGTADDLKLEGIVWQFADVKY